MMFPPSVSILSGNAGKARWAILLAIGSTLFCSIGTAEPPITTVAFAPDGRSFVTGSQSGVMTYHWPSLELMSTLTTRIENVHDLVFSSDGSHLAIAGGIPAESGSIEVLQWPAGNSISLCRGHSDTVQAVCWIDASSIASASLDHSICVWDIRTETRKMRLSGHSRGVVDVVCVRDKQQLVSGGLDQHLRVWSLESGELIRSLNNHTRSLHHLAMRPAKGLPMIASVADDRTLRLWQPTIGRMVRFARLESVPLAVAWQPNGQRVATACQDGSFRLINPETCEVLFVANGLEGWAYAVAAHPTDGSFLLAGQFGQMKRIQPAQ